MKEVAAEVKQILPRSVMHKLVQLSFHVPFNHVFHSPSILPNIVACNSPAHDFSHHLTSLLQYVLTLLHSN